jgi:uncharacterized protein YlxW (UPF0749 family)
MSATARLWPWSKFDLLTTDMRGARLACSAADRKANRLAARISKLDRTLARLRAQVRHDQAYIDALEARLDHAHILAARSEIEDRIAAAVRVGVSPPTETEGGTS